MEKMIFDFWLGYYVGFSCGLLLLLIILWWINRELSKVLK